MVGLAAVSPVAFVACFDELIQFSLGANAEVASVWRLFAIRLGVVAAAFVPIGWAIGGIVAVRNKTDERALVPINIVLASVVGGMIAGRWLLIGPLNVSQLVLVGVATLLAIALSSCRWLPSRSSDTSPSSNWFAKTNLFLIAMWRSNWFHRSMGVAAVLVIGGSPWLMNRYSPEDAARFLFSPDAIGAYRNGIESGQLAGINDSRLLTIREGQSGTMTVWAVQGCHRQFRLNGISQSVVSHDVRVSPHYPSELLATVIPLLLHETPREVLLLGSGGGLPIMTALDFPIRSLRWCDPDRTRTELIQEAMLSHGSSATPTDLFAAARPIGAETTTSETANGPLADDRLQLIPASPETMLAADRSIYDVVMSFPENAALFASSGQFTSEFYDRSAKRLTSTGLFCQRFQTADFGPEAIREALTTMSTAFDRVAAIESAPGEFVLLGTNSEAGFTRGNLQSRMQSPHVTSLLADVGWDWAITLKLNVLQGQAAVEYVQEMAAGSNTAASGRFAFSLTPELMRWADKSLELRTELGPYAHPLTAWLGELRPEVERRVNEVVTQRNLMADFPDQPFAYRAKLKSQLKSRPRTAIQLVSAETLQGDMHPEDERRMKYFQALDVAQKQDRPTSQSLLEIESFEWPYDPLVSYFVHGEIADLATKQSTRNPAFELRHRLYSVNYADSRDRSVTVVADAIKLLAEHPDAEPQAIERWDTMNGLLQMMLMRWNARKAHPPTSAVREGFNVDASLRAITAGLDSMDEWRQDAGIDADAWASRREFLQFNLVHPLRVHRDNLLPHQHRQAHRELESDGKELAKLEEALSAEAKRSDGPSN